MSRCSKDKRDSQHLCRFLLSYVCRKDAQSHLMWLEVSLFGEGGVFNHTIGALRCARHLHARRSDCNLALVIDL